MKTSTEKLFAIGLAAAFALVSSAVVVGIVLQYTYFDEARGGAGSQASQTVSSRGGPQHLPAMSRQRGSGGESADSNAGETPEVVGDFPDEGPRMVARGPGDQRVVLPMVETDYAIDVRGDLATVTVEQTFENPSEVPLDAQYQLPMAEDAAVYEMIMRVGDRRIRGEVQEKQEARETYEEAKNDGKAAALLEQQRENLFTQRLANVMPETPVEVTIRYVENIEKVDGRYQMVVPLVVGPRYEPGDMSDNELIDGESEGAEGDSVDLPAVSELEAPETIDPDRVSIEARIDGGVPVAGVDSASHALATSKLDPRTRRVELEEGRTIGNRHFVLGYELEGRSTQAGVLTHWNEKLERGYFSLLVEPPARPKKEQIASREMVFLLDTSGSMQGAPMEAARTYMRETLRNLRPGDAFRIVEFDGETGAMSREPLAATEENVERGISYVDRLHGGGGTEMVPGLEAALGPQEPDERVRMVTMLSDGYVGNEYEVIETVRREIGDSRLFVLGVGAGVNRFALEEMAEVGRGFTRTIGRGAGEASSEQIREAASEVADRLETPVLTDISVDWGELEARETTPERVPDLFGGDSVRIMGRYDEPGDYEIAVRGRAGSEEVEIPLEFELPGEPTAGRGVELTWARSRIEDYMHRLTTPDDLRTGTLGDEGLRDRVTRLGLTHDLATKWTSFVAVSDKAVNPTPQANAEAEAPEPQVANVSSSGYGGPSKATGTPEPTVLGSLLMALLAWLGIARKTRRRGRGSL